MHVEPLCKRDLVLDVVVGAQEGSKPIFHLAAFAAQFMSSFKKWMSENFE